MWHFAIAAQKDSDIDDWDHVYIGVTRVSNQNKETRSMLITPTGMSNWILPRMAINLSSLLYSSALYHINIHPPLETEEEGEEYVN